MSVRGEDERKVPWDGASPGRLRVRGPCVVSGYFGADAPAVDGGGWFDTGDIAVVHPDAVMQITDRAKDVIKSGGEWISRSEEHTSELQSLMRISYAVFCLKKKKHKV